MEQIEALLKKKKTLKEEEAEELSKVINVEAAEEFTSARKEKYANLPYIKEITGLATAYEDNATILRNIVSAVGFIGKKYEFYPDAGFDFIVGQIGNKNNIVKTAVVKNIFRFPQFVKMDKCWDYLLTVPSIAPKKDSMDYFYVAVKTLQKEIPASYIDKIKAVFKAYIDKNPEQYAVKEYKVFLTKLK
jgi:hypothetical protein